MGAVRGRLSFYVRMTKIRKLLDKIHYAHLACLIVGIMMVLLACVFGSYDNVRLHSGEFRDYSSGWAASINGGEFEKSVLMPYRGPKSAESTLIMKKKLGKEATVGNFIMFRIVHTITHVYIGDEEVYSFGTNTSRLFPLPGCAWAMIPLEDGYAGKEIVLNLFSPEKKYSASLSRIYIGTQGGLIGFLLKQNKLGIFTSVMIAISALFMFVAWLLTRRLFKNNRLFYLVVFEAGVFIWSLNETYVMQFFMNNMELSSVLTFEILMLLPMPLLLYYAESSTREIARMSRMLAVIPVVNFIVNNFLHITGAVDLSNSLIITHLSILICSAGMLYVHVRYLKKRRSQGTGDISPGSVGVVILVALMLLDMIRYYTISNYLDTAEYSRLGMLIFILCLAYETLSSGFRFVVTTKQADVYRQLAFTDNLTGVGNRQAYEERLRELDADDYENMTGFCAAMLDLNNLKRTNDTLGHAEGDRYIISSAKFVVDHFGKIADIYRLGGDEFAVVYAGKEKKEFFDEEKRMFADIANNGRTDINFSYGSAFFDVLLDRNIGDTIKRADERMYEAKRKYKQSMGKE